MQNKKCSCGCGDSRKSKCLTYHAHTKDDALTLADLPVGTSATIIKIMPGMRGKKKICRCGVGGRQRIVDGSPCPLWRPDSGESAGDQHGYSQR